MDRPGLPLPANGYVPDGGSPDLDRILQALDAVYSTGSSNELRKSASSYLEDAKRAPDAPSLGYTLALDKTRPAVLRHYGLSMLEYSVRYAWEGYSEEQTGALREYIVQLATSVGPEDPTYLRNKIGQLWTEAAKRSLGAEWANMDHLLVHLWETSLEQQALVLYILEALSEEVFNREDQVAGLRGHELGRACVEIFAPAAVLAQQSVERDTSVNVRYGDDGWIKRMCDLLDWCLNGDILHDERVRNCAIRIVHALKAAVSWVMFKAISATRVVDYICKALAVPVPSLQQVSVETLNVIFSRPLHAHEDDFVEIAGPMFSAQRVSLLADVYNWTILGMDVNDLDDQKYSLCKRISELCANLASLLERRVELVADGNDLTNLYVLFFNIFQNPSLVVSIPVLHAWTGLLRARGIRDSEAVVRLIPGLLETCCSRLVRYEALPEDAEEVTLLFLNEDIDTVPERHSFLGNYRRYCVEVVETIVRRTPLDAMRHILSQANSLLAGLYVGQPGFQPQTFTKYSIPVLRVDAQIAVIDAALKGYLKWVSARGADPQQDEREMTFIQDALESWCREVMTIKFEDPEIRRKINQLLVTLSTKALQSRPTFALSLLEYLFNVSQPDFPEFPSYSHAVKDLDRACSTEMQRLAIAFPNELMEHYDDLERKINDTLAVSGGDDRQRIAFQSFLFIIIHRSSHLDRAAQEAKLQQMLQPVKAAWQNPELTQSLSSFSSFCELVGFGGLPEFFAKHNFAQVEEWSAQPLDAEGQSLQANITTRSQQLPLGLARTLLDASTLKLQDESQAMALASSLWADVIPAILPNLLQLVSHAQAFNNIENWSHLPGPLQGVIKRVLTDRFWQAGISTESRDEFFARVSSSKSTFEGFASTVRGTVRQIREQCYWILYSMSRFRDRFYGIPDLPGPLSAALFSNARGLSSHHLSVLLNMVTQLIDGCPPECRGHFLPPLVSGLFIELDTKITSEWAAVNKQISERGDNDDLGDEMKTESILRQLTHSSMLLVASLLDYQRSELPQRQAPEGVPKKQTLWSFIMSTPQILEPVLVFCKDIIRVRDSRSCTLSLRVLRGNINHFKENSPVHDFVCRDILQAAITSLHEPYFVDVQKELAGLIAQIILLDLNISRPLILSLPGIDEGKVDKRLTQLQSAPSERLQRAIVLDLLETVRGVSIHEQGRIKRPPPKTPKVKQEYTMAVEEQPRIERGGSPTLVGVAEMFG